MSGEPRRTPSKRPKVLKLRLGFTTEQSGIHKFLGNAQEPVRNCRKRPENTVRRSRTERKALEGRHVTSSEVLGKQTLSESRIFRGLPVLEHCTALPNPRKLHNACSNPAQGSDRSTMAFTSGDFAVKNCSIAAACQGNSLDACCTETD